MNQLNQAQVDRVMNILKEQEEARQHRKDRQCDRYISICIPVCFLICIPIIAVVFYYAY
jgi:hypothetical protein